MSTPVNCVVTQPTAVIMLTSACGLAALFDLPGCAAAK